MERMRRWLLFVGSLVLALFLLWFGSRFLLFSALEITDLQHGMLAVACVLFAVWLFDVKSRTSVIVCVLLMGVGAYEFAHAIGLIEYSWLAKVIAGLCWLASVFVVAACLPSKKKTESSI